MKRAMRRGGPLALTALLLAVDPLSIPASSDASPEAVRPNIVVILVDDLRWDALDAAGHEFVRNPGIDRLAKEGAWFRNAFTTTPLCAPSRASFLTGRYARSHEVRTNDDYSELSHRLVTFPLLLEKAGYETAFIGKWHIGGDDAPRPGFTHWVSFSGQGVYRHPELNIDGRRERVQGYLTDLLNHYAVDFVRTAARGNRPFLLYLSHKAVHEPFNPASRHDELYSGEVVRCSPGCDDSLQGKPALTREVPGTAPPRPGGGPSDEEIRKQLALLASVDDGVVEILDVLEEEGVLDETAILFTSDNGFFHREHGLHDKRWAYEEAIRIPLLLRYPRLAPPGVRIDALVLNADLAPTLLELGSAAVPAEAQGRSFLPLLSGRPVGWRDAFVAEYFEEGPFPRIPTWEAIRTERFKYIRYPGLGDEFDELYDLLDDPYELWNRIDAPHLAAERDRLRGELDRLVTLP